MKYRTLGQLATPISAIGYGAMSFSDFYGPTDDEKSHAILTRCLDLGITHIDTSNVYGAGISEARIGSFLAKQGKQASASFSIATKAAITSKPDGTRYFDNSRQHLESELDKSLTRLGVEQVELLYVHRRDAAVPIEEVAESLAALVASGKTRQVGFSEIAPTSLAVAHEVHPVAAVQSEYSLSTRSPEMGLVQETASRGTSLVAFCPVGRSLLTDNPLDYETSQGLGFLKVNPRFQEANLKRNLSATEPFRKLAAEMGTTSASLAIAWLLAQGDHVIPIPGTRSTDHLNELAAGVDLTLSETDIAAIEQTLPVGWCHGDRYAAGQWNGPERYC
ncbi:MAG: aryl-alcohol dehydrogenase-like predicted oxidoreductase [Candidatus Azotimanducaceae bacterium]|jgi:aryl-alcohol dehydrogenase-like predicted oxidoreductase